MPLHGTSDSNVGIATARELWTEFDKERQSTKEAKASESEGGANASAPAAGGIELDDAMQLVEEMPEEDAAAGGDPLLKEQIAKRWDMVYFVDHERDMSKSAQNLFASWKCVWS